MALIEEHWINGGLWRGLGHVCLTSTTFTFSVILMRWALEQIPISAIRDVQLQQHMLRQEVTISYMASETTFKTLSFSTNQLAQWRKAFERLGVHVTTQT